MIIWRFLLVCIGVFVALFSSTWWQCVNNTTNPLVTEWDAWLAWCEAYINIPGITEQDTTEGDGEVILLDAIKSAINWVLAILALIAVIIIMWAWFSMLTAAGNEERYKRWFSILKNAAIGLFVIGLAALFVWLVFFIINRFGVTWEQSAGTFVSQ